MDNYTVYVHICPNGKRYYGSTGMNVNRRWKDGRGYKNQLYFWEAIEKFGWCNIQHIIVAKKLTKDESHWLEEMLINAWDTTNSDKGYNISKGVGSKGLKRSEEHKKKISKVNAKPVICITTGRIFYTLTEGAKYYKIKRACDITQCCRCIRDYAGEYNGQKLVWRYIKIIEL